jgi:Protein kinase domain
MTDETLSIMETRGIVGTARYMSPEQVLGKKLDARTDLWSLGVAYYASLTGGRPFQGESTMAVLRAITDKEPTPLLQMRLDAPPAAEQIVARALEKDQDKRYQMVSEVVRDTSELLAQMSSTTLVRAEPERGVPRLVAALVAIAFVLIVAAGVWFYHRSSQRHSARLEAFVPIMTKLPAFGILHLRLRKRGRCIHFVIADNRASRALTIKFETTCSIPPGCIVAKTPSAKSFPRRTLFELIVLRWMRRTAPANKGLVNTLFYRVCYMLLSLEKENTISLKSTDECEMLDNLYYWTDQEGISRERALEAAIIYFVNHGFDDFLADQQDPRFRPQTDDEEMNSSAMSAELLRKDPKLLEKIEGLDTLDDETKEEIESATRVIFRSDPRVQ